VRRAAANREVIISLLKRSIANMSAKGASAARRSANHVYAPRECAALQPREGLRP